MSIIGKGDGNVASYNLTDTTSNTTKLHNCKKNNSAPPLPHAPSLPPTHAPSPLTLYLSSSASPVCWAAVSLSDASSVAVVVCSQLLTSVSIACRSMYTWSSSATCSCNAARPREHSATTWTHRDYVNTLRPCEHTATTWTHCDHVNTQRPRQHTATTSTHCNHVNTLRPCQHTMTTSTHWDHINTLRSRQHTATMSTHHDHINTLRPRQHSTTMSTHCDHVNTLRQHQLTVTTCTNYNLIQLTTTTLTADNQINWSPPRQPAMTTLMDRVHIFRLSHYM